VCPPVEREAQPAGRKAITPNDKGARYGVVQRYIFVRVPAQVQEGLAMEDFHLRLRSIAALIDPSSEVGLSINLLLRDVERDQKRRAGQRRRTQNHRAKNRYGNVTVTVTPEKYPNTEDRYGNGYGNDVIEVSKKERIVSKKDITDKPKTKPSTCLSEDWELPQSWITFAVKHGMEPNEAPIEGLKFRNHYVAKGEKRKNWFFAWQNWCLNFLGRQKKSSIAKPLTPREMTNATIAAFRSEIDPSYRQDQPTNGGSLVIPIDRLLPSSPSPGDIPRDVTGDDHGLHPISRKHIEGDRQSYFWHAKRI